MYAVGLTTTRPAIDLLEAVQVDFGQFDLLRIDAPQPVVMREVGRDIDPFPALLAQAVCGFFEFGESKGLQKFLIEDEDAFVILGEEITADLTTGFLVGLEGDEFDGLVRGGDFTVG